MNINEGERKERNERRNSRGKDGEYIRVTRSKMKIYNI